MSRVVFRMFEVECDSADEPLLTSLRELLEHRGGQPVAPPAPSNETKPPSRESTTPPSASIAPPDASKPVGNASPASKVNAVAEQQAQILELVELRPGSQNTDIADAVLGDTSRGALMRLGRVLAVLVDDGRLVRRGRDGAYYRPADAPPPRPPGRPPRTFCPAFPPCSGCRAGGRCVADRQPAPAAAAPLRVSVPLGEKMPPSNPTGRVEGFVQQTSENTALLGRLIDMVKDRPGCTVQDLARLALGSSSAHNVRRVDFLIGPVVMGGRLVRTNGRLFESAEQVAAAPPPPIWQLRKPGERVPLNDVQRQKDAFNRIVAAFTEDHAYPIAKLAEELFGETTGRTTTKLQLMLRQLVATERLVRIEGNQYRPPGDSEQLRRDEEADDAGDGDEDKGDDQLESNGQPDDWAEEELDLS